jgi:lipoprotein NlpD
VKKGETLWSISRAYNVGIQQIAEANKITNVSQIKENSVLFIPGADHTIDFTQKSAALETESAEEELPQAPENVADESKISTKEVIDTEPAPVSPERKEIGETDGKTGSPPAVSVPAKSSVKPESNPPDKKTTSRSAESVVPSSRAVHSETDKTKFVWPVNGSITSRFGIQPNGMKVNGIKILAPDSAPIVASATGAVIHSANIKYYGDTVIIKHDENFSTVYCYLKERTVKVGDIVKKGDKIALVGKPENGDGKSYLHFEVRYRSKPRDPLLYLP